MGLENQKSYLSTSQLKKASMWSPDRALLKAWMDGTEVEGDWKQEDSTKESVPSVEKSSQEAKPTKTEEQTSKEEVQPKAKVESAGETEAQTEDKPVPKPASRREPAKLPEVVKRPTKLGDDLSHLSPRVRAIVEKSRAIRAQTEEQVEETSEKVEKEEASTVERKSEFSAPEPAGEAVSKQASDEGVEKADIKDTPVKIEIEELPEPPVEEVKENFELTSIQEPLSEEEGEQEVEENRENSVESSIEERHFPRPIILDELTSEEEAEDDPIQLDFSAWLRMKQGVSPESEKRESDNEEPAPIDESIEFEVPEEEASEEEVTPMEEDHEVEFELEEDTIEKESYIEPELKAEEQKVNKMQLIDRFLKDQPKITPRKKEDKNEETTSTSRSTIDVSAMGSEVGDDFITETLAQVYKQQGYLDKAMSAYEILSLKYPEKSSFFADQISEIRRQKRRLGK